MVRVFVLFLIRSDETGDSAGEDVDDKIRMITTMLGVELSEGEDPPPSFQEVVNSIADIRRDAEGFREEIDTQSVSQLSITIHICTAIRAKSRTIARESIYSTSQIGHVTV